MSHFMQTPKRPNLPATPSTYCKTSLPPLSSILKKEAMATPYNGGNRLPSIDTFTTPISSTKFNSQFGHSTYHPMGSANLTLATPSKVSSSSSNANFSFANSSMDHSETDITPIESAAQSKTSSPIESKAYAFISHSPATFPNQEPSIDNAPLARRKRRRTSPNELSILNKEFEAGSTPNKLRRIEISKKVMMTEKAVQIWFQNKRQSLRKHSTSEKEVTELPQVSEPILTASTPIKPILTKSQSFVSPPPVIQASPIQKRSLSTNCLPRLPPSTPLLNKMIFRSSTPNMEMENPIDQQLVLNETKKKQPNFLNSRSSSTMTFKLAPAKTKSPKREQAERKPLSELSVNVPNKVNAKLESVKKTGENECIVNLLSLRAGNWK
ncbi:homeobox protein Yox1p [[Candida] anglica]|uniref:Homeobox protein Yox1p n=1 Tax=[Candida] anglica TaxID=148631 RepID=A0ABP0EBE2_9ASCO